MSNRLPFRKSSAIRKEVEKFVLQHSLTLEIPVDIETIIEKNLDMDIVAIPKLEKTFGFDCYINSNFDKIVIDEDCFVDQEMRARFSLAHELSHKVLHQNIYEAAGIDSEESFVEFSRNLTDKEQKSLEIQAHIFAGFLLLPHDYFESELENLSTDYGGTAKMTVSDLGDVMKYLSRKFNVTDQVIWHQLKHEYPLWLREIIGDDWL